MRSRPDLLVKVEARTRLLGMAADATELYSVTESDRARRDDLRLVSGLPGSAEVSWAVVVLDVSWAIGTSLPPSIDIVRIRTPLPRPWQDYEDVSEGLNALTQAVSSFERDDEFLHEMFSPSTGFSSDL